MAQETLHPLAARNAEESLYFDGGEHTEGRVVFIPRTWAAEFGDGATEDEAPGMYGWIGGPDVLAYQTRTNHEYLTTDAQGWISFEALAQMRLVDAAEARRLDPDLFTLLNAVDSGEAR